LTQVNDESPQGGGDRPDYKVYRSRPGLLSRLPTPDLSGLRDKLPGGGEREPSEPKMPKPPREPGAWKRWLKWIGVGVAVWILISLVAFAVSAQIQKSKLANGAADALDGNPFLSVSPQNILVLGTDARPSGLASEGETASDRCLEAAGKGRAAQATNCDFRSDTIMVVRAGGGTFRKLSIPRDALADIPGSGTEKINSAYAIGGAELTVETVENFLGIDIDHLAIVDFTGFRDFIDALGGIEVDLDEPVCSEISGGEENGGITLDLKQGENELDGDEALSLARTRTSGDCNDDGTPDSDINDLDRVRFQQEIISGIKGKLTSPLSLPFNLLRGPLIGWNAPKALVTDMGALTMPQLLFAAVIGGDSPTKVLEPTSSDGSSLFIAQDECREKVEELLGGEPERDPACSPLG
jgi:LCP family protein required for cell wall assembly